MILTPGDGGGVTLRVDLGYNWAGGAQREREREGKFVLVAGGSFTSTTTTTTCTTAWAAYIVQDLLLLLPWLKTLFFSACFTMSPTADGLV